MEKEIHMLPFRMIGLVCSLGIIFISLCSGIMTYQLKHKLRETAWISPIGIGISLIGGTLEFLLLIPFLSNIARVETGTLLHYSLASGLTILPVTIAMFLKNRLPSP